MSQTPFDATPETDQTDDADLTDLVDQPDLDEADETDEAAGEGHDDDDDETGAATSGAAASGGPRKTISRAQIKRIVSKTVEVSEADKKHRAAAAGVLGVADNVTDLTTAIMSADRSAGAPINDLNSLLDAEDAIEMAVLATALTRDRLKGVWTLLKAFGQAPSAEPPASAAKAGMALARVTAKLPDETRTEISSVAALLKKA